jgi:rSAM/selenodomain-associated transferase 2
MEYFIGKVIRRRNKFHNRLIKMTISIIIPTFNESKNIAALVKYLLSKSDNTLAEVIVCDGGSNDNTAEIAKLAGANTILSQETGRAVQMNLGASIAKGDILYFIHADCFPPKTFIKDIQQAISHGYDLGRYRTMFLSNKKILKFNAWFTRFDIFFCMGGDQTLFIKKSFFKICSGFNEKMKIMEDYDFCERARKKGKYKILKGTALVSDRKYSNNRWLTVQLANLKIVKMYKKGASQQEMINIYKKLLNPY